MPTRGCGDNAFSPGGPVAHPSHHHALSWHGGLTVVGRRGRADVGRIVRGRVAGAVLRRAPCPVPVPPRPAKPRR
ncbi:MAG: universal stress protein [Proteobacteria bacterium]|nr:universal stress protein [Pseudomonadota bacterium]